jgi:hypothetical protein
MQNITLHSCADADGNLQLNIPTTLPNTELEVLVFFTSSQTIDSRATKDIFTAVARKI